MKADIVIFFTYLLGAREVCLISYFVLYGVYVRPYTAISGRLAHLQPTL
jgi:hypothetical protein